MPTRIHAHGLTLIEWRMIELAVQGVSRSHIAQQLCRAELDVWYRAEVAKVVDAERVGGEYADDD